MFLTCLALGAACCGADPIPVRKVTIDDQQPARPYAKIVADFDGDDYPDIAIGGAQGPLVWYQYPSWQKRRVTDGGYETVEGQAADIDGDGDLDIVMGGILWYENPGRKQVATAPSWTPHRVARVRTHDVEVGDLDGDGKLDLVTRNQSSFGNPSGNRFHIWKQQTPDKWEQREIECPHGEGIQLFDLDQDGDLDVVIGGRWYENAGNILQGHWAEHVYAADWHPDAEVQCRDISGDGRPDIVLTPAELQGNTYRISWFEAPENARDPNWQEHVIEPQQETVVHALGVGDFNNDGHADVVIAEMHQGKDPDEVRVYLNQGRGARWTRQVVAVTGSHDIVLADIGNDGDLDIVGANHAGDHSAVEWWENLLK